MSLRILAPMDGSDVTFRALEGALDLLKGRPGLHVTLLNVVSEGLADAPDELVEQFDEDEDDELFPHEDAGRRMLARAETICSERDVPFESRVRTGKVADLVFAMCKDHDILVMHALEKKQIKETLRGSQTEKYARKAGIAVLLVPTS